MHRSRCRKMVLSLLIAGVWAVALQSGGVSGLIPEAAPATAHDARRLDSPSSDQARAKPIPDAAWVRMLESIDADRFAVQPLGTAGAAPYRIYNRAHGLQATFAEDGVRVRSSGSGGGSWEWTLQLEHFGYEGSLRPVEAVPPVAEGNRVEYRRDGLTEWYVNDPRGLEQGFTLARRPPSGQTTVPVPAANGAVDSPLVLELRASGLETRQAVAGESILLVGDDGAKTLHYRGLIAWDADGTDLPAEMWATDSGIRIEVDDAGAIYPLTVDPFIESTVLHASDAATSHNFGHSSAISRDTAIVGTYDPEAAYILERNHGGQGNWGEVRKLMASDTQTEDYFGLTVAVSGDTAIVGAFGEDGGPGDPFPRVGAAYIFERNAGGPDNWGEVKKLTASDSQAGDQFGLSVAISADTAIVGATSEDGGPGDPLVDAGAAYVFERNEGGAGNWGEVEKLTASDAQAVDLFGDSVALDGDTAVVSAVFEDSGSPQLTGAAYVFERNHGGAGSWGEVAKLTASDAGGFDMFGDFAAISGDTVIIGAPSENGGPGDPLPQAGAAYIFERDQGGADNWGEVTKLTASDAQANDTFGWSVAISGDSAVVGASYEDGGLGDPLPVSGAVYVFERNQGGAGHWEEARKLAASDTQVGDLFGYSVAIDGDTAFVGAVGEDGGPGAPISAAGAAYVFDRTTWAYVLEGFGGVHAAGLGVVSIAPATPYFGFDIARDMELSVDGAYVMDGIGGLHPAGSATAMSPGPPYRGYDIMRDFELAAGSGGYAIDGHGSVHALGGAPLLSPPSPFFGWDVVRDLELGAVGYYVLDRNGNLYTGARAVPITPEPPNFGFDIARDVELEPGGGAYVLDGFGGVHAAGDAPDLIPLTPYFGWDIARDLELAHGGGHYVLDGYGGLHAGGGAMPISSAPPYFGFDIARDLEIR